MESFVAFFERPIYPATSVKIRFGQVLEMFFWPQIMVMTWKKALLSKDEMASSI